MEGLNWQTIQFSFAAGLNQKPDPRVLQQPELLRATDVQFDEIGGLQTRYPYALKSTNIYGGGALSDMRRVVENGDELLLFTKTGLYSWNAQASAWVLKAIYLAPKITEGAAFINPADQIDCDRAELGNTIVISWVQRVGAASLGYVAALDKTTGNVTMQPTRIVGTAGRLRVTALTTKILLSFYDGISGLYAYALDPASPATALAGASTTLTNTNFGTYYDIVKVPGADQAAFATRQAPTTSYWVGTVTAGLVVAKSSKARTCDGPIAVSCDPTGSQIQVVRANGTNIQGDLITLSTLADVFTAQAIGTAGSTPVNQIAAAHRSVQDGGAYRCYAFWSYNETADTNVSWGSKYNYVDTANAIGVQAALVNHVGVASRAWDHDGSVYVWLAFGAASYVTDSTLATTQLQGLLQNTYFLYRDDGLLVAKAADNEAGGFAFSTGALPGVASSGTNMYTWCGVERRKLALGNNLEGYSARAPHQITVEFDSNEARRCARLGRTLYIAGGEVLQYDGTGLYEVGFHIYPWQLDLTDWGAGSMAVGAYGYKGTLRWDNAQGERERSTTATSGLVNIAAANREASIIPWCASNITHKTANPAAFELWRTLKDPGDVDAPFYLATSSDPTATANPNRYLANDPTSMGLSAVLDALSDAAIGVLEQCPENGSVLENLSPPPASIIFASEDRLFLGGVANDEDRIWYSKQRNAGEIAAFHEILTVEIPNPGGLITALTILQETLVVFRENAVYLLPGDGYDNTGGGQNYGPPHCVSADIGAVNHESVAVTDKGIVFKSNKGWYLLNRGWQLDYIGGPICDYDDLTPIAVNVVESQHQVRILVNVPTLDVPIIVIGDPSPVIVSRMLVLDTYASDAYGRPTWAEWTINDGVHACMWRGAHVYLSSAGPKQQATDYTGVDYGMDVELQIKPGDLEGWSRIRKVMPLGEWRSAFKLRVRLARDYATTYFQDKTWTPSPASVGEPLQLKHGPKIEQMQAIKVRLTAVANADGTGVPSGEALKLTGLGLEVGFKPGLRPNLPAAQRQ